MVAPRIFAIYGNRAGCCARPFTITQVRRDRIAVLAALAAEVFRKPALLANENRGVIVALVADRVSTGG